MRARRTSAVSVFSSTAHTHPPYFDIEGIRMSFKVDEFAPRDQIVKLRIVDYRDTSLIRNSPPALGPP